MPVVTKDDNGTVCVGIILTCRNTDCRGTYSPILSNSRRPDHYCSRRCGPARSSTASSKPKGKGKH